jgi:hypothetical protein
MPTHAEKNRGRRVLFPLKRANISPFDLYDRAAGRAVTNKRTKGTLEARIARGELVDFTPHPKPQPILSLTQGRVVHLPPLQRRSTSEMGVRI